MKRIGKEAFYESILQEIHIPSSVEELGEGCFDGCQSLSCVTFGASSQLKRICRRAFCRCNLEKIHIPNSVEELCDELVYECWNLSSVIFGRSPSLKRIGVGAFFKSSLREIHIPDIVEFEQLLTEAVPWRVRVIKHNATHGIS